MTADNIARWDTALDDLKSLTFNVKDYRAAGDGSTDDTAAVQNAWAELVAAGGGTLYFPKGSYNVLLPLNTHLIQATSLRGITIHAPSATITDTRTYTGTQQSIFLRFYDCHDVTIRIGKLVSTTPVSSNPTAAMGADAFQFLQGCSRVTVDAEVQNYKLGLGCVRDSTDPQSYKTRGVRARLKTTGTFYPLSFQFSGDDVDAWLDADTPGRAYFPYGVKNHHVHVRAKNQLLTSIIGHYDTVEDMHLWFYNRESDGTVDGADCIRVLFGGPTAMTHRNLNFYLDMKNVLNGATYAFDHGIAFFKVDASDVADPVGRGHVLDGCRVTGVIEQVAATFRLPISNTSATFAAPDVLYNCVAEDFRETGTASTYPPGFVRRASGTGTPEAVLTAPIGSTYQRYDGGAGTCFYVKEAGAGNVGWVGK